MTVRTLVTAQIRDALLARRLFPGEFADPARAAPMVQGHINVPPDVERVLIVAPAMPRPMGWPDFTPFAVWVDPDAMRQD